MKKDEARKFTLSLMNSSLAIYLATVDSDGLPNIRALSNLRHSRQYPDLRDFFKQQEEPFVTYVSTFSSSAKAKQIRENSQVAVYFSRPEKFQGVMLSGSMESVRDRATKEALWQKQWKVFWPKGTRDPKYRVLRFVPTRAKGWSGKEAFRFSI